MFNEHSKNPGRQIQNVAKTESANRQIGIQQMWKPRVLRLNVRKPWSGFRIWSPRYKSSIPARVPFNGGGGGGSCRWWSYRTPSRNTYWSFLSRATPFFLEQPLGLGAGRLGWNSTMESKMSLALTHDCSSGPYPSQWMRYCRWPLCLRESRISLTKNAWEPSRCF